MANTSYARLTTEELESIIAKHKAEFKDFDAPPASLKVQAKTISNIRTILDSRTGRANDDTEKDVPSS